MQKKIFYVAIKTHLQLKYHSFTSNGCTFFSVSFHETWSNRIFFLFSTCRTQGFPIFSCPDRNKVNFSPSGSAFCPVKILCSSFFPAERTARPGSLDHQNAGQMSTLFTEATAQNGFHPVPSEHCSIRKCLLLS